MAITLGRALHFVFKIGDRKATIDFYKNVLGMKILRHEEFSEGCEAACNGPYANRWSKTMVGYGPEDNHFVIELTYNYPIKSYEQGNDFIGITIKSKHVLENALKLNWPILPGNILEAPGGYKFYILDQPQPTNQDPVEKVTLACSSLEKTVKYWNTILGLKIFQQETKKVTLGFNETEAKLEFQEIDKAINHATAFGRIAFACPAEEQPTLETAVKSAGGSILTPLVKLDTPGKASVQVVILADPDGHEICFVDEEGFRQLSKVDEDGDRILQIQIAKDKS